MKIPTRDLEHQLFVFRIATMIVYVINITVWLLLEHFMNFTSIQDTMITILFVNILHFWLKIMERRQLKKYNDMMQSRANEINNMLCDHTLADEDTIIEIEQILKRYRETQKKKNGGA